MKYNDVKFKSTYLTVTEFANLVGVSAATLRTWCDNGKFKPALIMDSGRRMYSINQVEEFKSKYSGIGHTGKVDNQDIMCIYTVNEEFRKRDTCEAVVDYLKQNGCDDFLDISNGRLRLFVDNVSQPSNQEAYPGMLNLAGYIQGKKVRGVLVALDRSDPDELNLLRAITKMCKVLGLPMVSVFSMADNWRKQQNAKASAGYKMTADDE